MKLGYIGLGKMGFNMVERLLEKGYGVVVYNRSPEPVRRISGRGARPADSLRDLATALPPPRLIWIMVAHQAVETVLNGLVPLLERGDTVIDGGNSPYKESMRRAEELNAKGIGFLDAGVSGGPHGARTGACIMVGGPEHVYEKFEPLLRDLTVPGGLARVGPAGAGHFVKMVHNGIEYGMMQALAEGFALMKRSPFRLNLTQISGLYNHRSVIESRLVGWLHGAFLEQGEDLAGVSGSVAHSGEGLWTVEAARELGVPAPIIEGALNFRIQSKENPSYTGRLLTALRNRFGGHALGG